MKSRFLMFSLLLLVFVVGIGAISAEDTSDIGEISSDEVTDEVISVDDTVTDVSTSDDDEETSVVQSTQNDYTWADFQSEVEDTSVNTVKLNKSNIAPSSSSSDQVTINHDITIVGGYGYYIGNADWNSAASYDYIPMITSGNNLNVNFENVTFQYLSNNIFIKLMGNGNFAFKNCVFNNINCTGDHQSVIWLNYGYALIENCTFTNVTSSFGAVTNYYTSWGTAVNNARMTVKGSTFKDNHATTEPGAINNCGKLIVYDSIFENNSATWWAGAIHTHSNANTTVVRSNFRNNIAGWNGGALYSYSYLTVINSTFTANEAHQTSGGAIAASAYMSKPVVVIENCDFDDNLAYGSGGAISFGGTSLTVSDSRFNDNTANSSTGGAISSGGTTANINNCNFTYNVASSRGGAIYASGAGYLNVYYSNFVNNTGSEGNDIAYYYATKKTNAAFLTYDYNEFWGVNNSSGSIYAYDTQYLNVTPTFHNVFHDISEYVDPSGGDDTNDTNITTGNVTIPEDVDVFESSWDIALDGALSGTPVISGNYILIPATHTLYCYNAVSQSLVWNFTTEHGYFHELVVEDNKVYAPASGDALFIFYLNNGSLVTYNNLPQASSLFAPLIYNGTIYVSSEYGYGDNNNTWIAMVSNADYSYDGSILEINGIAYGNQALLSKPYIYGNNLYVNTVNGLMSYNLVNGTTNIVGGTVGNPIIDANGNICILSNNGNNISLLDSNLNEISSVALDGACDMLVSDGNGNVYTVDENGYIYYASYTSSSLSCSKTEFNINPITSAITYYDDYLYIGDNNGILWVFDVDCLSLDELDVNSLYGAFDAGSAITGGITVNNNGNIYFGTADGCFYRI